MEYQTQYTNWQCQYWDLLLFSEYIPVYWGLYFYYILRWSLWRDEFQSIYYDVGGVGGGKPNADTLRQRGGGGPERPEIVLCNKWTAPYKRMSFPKKEQKCGWRITEIKKLIRVTIE